ncbi:MAG: energy transducer TonB, partial [Silanimonas sp.]
PEADTPEPTQTPIDWAEPPPPPPIAPPPPVVRTVVPVRPAVPTLTPPLVPVPLLREPTAAPVLDVPSPLDTVAPETGVDSTGFDAGPTEETLALRAGTPPRYPPAALSRRLEGEVELLILVGIDGRPESVTVTRSSGHALLDRTAREHVLRRWVFEPSLRNGIAVPAYARVPVRFTLP